MIDGIPSQVESTIKWSQLWSRLCQLCRLCQLWSLLKSGVNCTTACIAWAPPSGRLNFPIVTAVFPKRFKGT
eukprot:813868-Prorocentrum_minimum.AAC.1